MHLIDRIHKERYVSFSFVLIVLITGCLPVPEPTDAEQRIFDTWLQLMDFPQGWQAERGTAEDEEGIVCRVRYFTMSADLDKYSVLVSHGVSVYADSGTASDAYSGLEARWFPTSIWVEPEQLQYQSPTADRYRLGCMPVSIGGIPAHSCGAVGQYHDMTSVLLANVFEDRWFTWGDLEHVLQVIDERMAAQMQ